MKKSPHFCAFAFILLKVTKSKPNSFESHTESTKNRNRKSPRHFVANVPVASQTAVGMLFARKNRKSRRNRCVNPSQPKNRNVFLVFCFIIIIIIIIIIFCAGRFSRASRKGQRDPLCRYANMSWYPIICFSSKSITSLALSTSPAPSANTEDGELRS